MADKALICKFCGGEFIFTEGEQTFYQEKGFSEPQSCPACRARRKAERQGQGGFGGGQSKFNNRPKPGKPGRN